ncbi:MAG TPA: hypothetical protein VMU81_13950 [Acetobacteraceae bacterium]|jgi:hypothetical protein|nr:hypothetical protein [Acetobacteraceae bacterium]
MSVSPRRVLFAAALATPVVLSACAPDPNQFPPACPGTALLGPTADVAIYRPGTNGQDLTALMLAGRMESIEGKCQPGDKTGTVAATVVAGAMLTRGPAMPGNVATVPVFVAVTEGDRILDKRVYRVQAVFPSNVDRVTVSTPPVNMVLPVSQTKSAAAYVIMAGFQLTRDQLAANRAQGDQ